MDAKPQRPGRLHRDRGLTNENAPMEPKVLHQRFKSMGNISTVSTGISSQTISKRTAFGDLSNVSRTLSRDDSAIGGKNIVVSVDKESIRGKENAPGPPSGAAQRFHGTQVLKPTAKNALVATHKQAVVAAPVVAPLNARKQSKRDTQIYKDPEPAVAEHPKIAPEEVVQVVAPITTRAEDVVHEDNDKELKVKQSREDILSKHDGAAKEVTADEKVNNLLHPAEEVIAKSDDTIEDVNAGLSTHVATTSSEETEEQKAQEDLERLIAEGKACFEKAALDEGTGRKLVHISEGTGTEEYWIDEDELYEEEDELGEARSYHGDNTTNMATVPLIPKYTAQIHKDLAFAKRVIEDARKVMPADDDNWDVTMVAEYGDEIFDYLRELEIKMLPNANYMDTQTEIQWSMRSILMEWLVQVHSRFNLLPETLFLSVNYIDRFLSRKIVSLGKLQLVGATALLIASKFEEINSPSLAEIVYMVDGGYTIDEILKAERFMLSMLQFELGFPGPLSFLRRISKADDYDYETRTLAKYFMEVTIMDERFVGCPPSFIAAGSHCLARSMLQKGGWTLEHMYYSNYTWEQIRPIMGTIVECCEDARLHHSAVYEKYADRRFRRASLFTEAELERGWVIPGAPPGTYLFETQEPPSVFGEGSNSLAATTH